ncbi:MAG TPA: ABC transporter transmembrane domain-containing protein [Aquabacterium sp.]|uniref:ABC transporter transmembrane domain-containing protein n=1 Tax=Aquabacterium sp. TaxID=1872578 RepID=UPI002E301236|nr:ABC transporter transmembrane domain-containing protein [Aquabacterium sp.]HEX5371131.1 ABC transporter transmembrane domain-containing protein [Aquabacterium sp.]
MSSTTSAPALPSDPSPPGDTDTAATVKASPGALRSLAPFLRPYRGRIAAALVFLVLAALTTLMLPLALRNLIDQGFLPADPGERVMALREHFLALGLVGVALGVFSASRYYCVTWLGERLAADLKSAVYSHVLRQSPQFFETTQTGEVLSRLTADTTLIQSVVGSSLSMGLRNAIMGIGALVMLVVTNPKVMASVLGFIVLVLVPAILAGRRVRRLSRDSQDRVADSSAIAAETLNAIPVVQSYTAEGREAARFGQATENAFGTSVRRARVRAALVAFVISGIASALLWGLYQGTQAVVEGRISAGHMGQTVVYVILLISSTAALSEIYGEILRAAGATERLIELLHSRSSIDNPAQPLSLPASTGGALIELEHIGFHYPSRPRQAALQDLSLTIQPGETIALVGPSGAGKTTVFQLLQRFYDPQSGRVLLDGTPIRQLSLHALRERIGVVPQDSSVFSASAMDNIRYGRPDATDDEVIAAAKAAHAHDFLLKLPEGYDTFLGERGVRLSGGQRQRISIARAILKNAPLLLLDEATSALDTESERAVQAALEEAMKGRTTLIIAHRLSTVINAHRIAVLDQGQLVDVGTHAELLSRCALYQRLASAQLEP